MNNETPNNEQESKPVLYTIYEQQMVSKIQHVYFSGPIEEPINYVEIIHRLHTALPSETFYFHLATPGGNLLTGIQLVNAFRASVAHIVCSIESQAQSLGALLFLAADEWVVHDNCKMMIHNYSGGVLGKGHEQVADLENSTKWVAELFKTFFIPFVTDDELERILRGEDLYLLSPDIRKRLNRVVKHLKQTQKDSTKK